MTWQDGLMVVGLAAVIMGPGYWALVCRFPRVAARSEAATRQRVAALLVAALLVLAALDATPLIPGWQEFWADRALLSGLVGAVLLVGAGYLVVDVRERAELIESGAKRSEIITAQAARVLAEIALPLHRLQESGQAPGCYYAELVQAADRCEHVVRRLETWLLSAASIEGPEAQRLALALAKTIGQLTTVADRMADAVEKLEHAWAENGVDAARFRDRDVADELDIEPIDDWSVQETARLLASDVAEVLSGFDLFRQERGAITLQADPAASWTHAELVGRDYFGTADRPGF